MVLLVLFSITLKNPVNLLQQDCVGVVRSDFIDFDQTTQWLRWLAQILIQTLVNPD